MNVKRALLVLLAIGVGVGLAVASTRMQGAATAPPATATIEAIWVPTSTPRPTPTPPAWDSFRLQPVSLGEDNAVGEGTYVIEVATRKLWKISSGVYTTSIRWLPDGRMLRILSGDPRYKEIWGIDIMSITTGSTNRILDGETGQVAVSPDGTQIAFTLPRPGASIPAVGLLHLVAVDGGTPRQVADSEMRGIQWSPKGDYIAFQREEQGNVHLLQLATGIAMEIDAVGLQKPISFAWSPDGETMAVAGANGLYLYTISTGRAIELPSGRSQRSVRLQWSPDGSALLRVDRFGDSADPYLIEIESGRVRALASAFDSLTWSPDSSQIAYLSDGCRTGVWDIFVTSVDSGITRRLTTPETAGNRVLGFTWSPDGSAIAFSARDKVMLVDVESGDVRLVAVANDGTRLAPSGWSADGRFLAFGFAPIPRGICD